MILTESFDLFDLLDKYSEEQITIACDELVNDYRSDNPEKELLKDFIKFNTDSDLKFRMESVGQYPDLDYIENMDDDELAEIIDDWYFEICTQVDLPFIRNYLQDNFGDGESNIYDVYESFTNLTRISRSLLEADNESDEEDIDFEDVDFSTEDAPEEEEIDVDEDETSEEETEEQSTDTVNETNKKDFQFPILIEANSQEGPQELEQEKIDDLVTQYQEAVIKEINDNKKFILSALDVYDFEVFYNELDSNNNLHFNLISETDIPNDQLISVLKRYFNQDITENEDDVTTTLSPVLDNKFIKIS